MNHPEVVSRLTRHGQMYVPIKDQYIGKSLDFYGEYSEGEVKLFEQIVQPGMWVCDIGANIGSFTLPLAKQVGPEGRVIGIEPQPALFHLLHHNCERNKVSNAVLFNAAAGAASGTALIPEIDYAEERNLGGVSLSDTGTEIPLITVDSLNLPRCDFMKIDVEGYEAEVLKGATRTLEFQRPILYVENDRIDKSHDLIALIMERGYDLWWHTPPLFNPDNFAGQWENLWPSVGSINMLCVPKGFTVDLRGFQEVDGPDDLLEFMR